MASIHPIIVGTAGHVDHGKSSLVRALTGIDPDRWEEEKERGLTIDLGYAPMELADGRLVGLIDVPGHERFLKNMVAGATSIDLAILVVAADDGVMPQTREHLDVLELLGVRQGIVALTKVDLVDPETLELAVEDVRELLQGHCLEGAEICPLSTVTGKGLPEFRARLEALAGAVEPRPASGYFRLPIQRKFSVAGFGTVLTGIPLSGTVSVGDELHLVGKGLRSRIRGIQAYGRKVDQARAGHSTALNLPDIPLDKVERGDVLAASAELEPTNRLEADLRVVGDMAPLIHGEEVHLHVGTREATARVFPLDRVDIPPGDEGLVQIHVHEEVTALPGDFVLLRRLNPPRTVAGGRILGSGGRRLRRLRDEVIARLQSKEASLGDPEERLRLLVVEHGPNGLASDAARARLGWTAEELELVVEPLVADRRLFRDPRNKALFSAHSVGLECERIERMLAGWFRKHATTTTCPITRFRTAGAHEGLMQMALVKLAADGRVEVLAGGRVRDLGRKDPLTPEQRERRELILARAEEAGFRPLTRPELLEGFGADAGGLLDSLVEDGGLQLTNGGFVWGGGTIDRALAIVEAVCAEHDGVLDIPTLRDRMETSRKYLIPFLEHLDRLGVTARKGDRRILRRK
ncbi:MAG: selenocysteine-specific translation elongation factor [Planctomycetota bacterium]